MLYGRSANWIKIQIHGEQFVLVVLYKNGFVFQKPDLDLCSSFGRLSIKSLQNQIGRCCESQPIAINSKINCSGQGVKDTFCGDRKTVSSQAMFGHMILQSLLALELTTYGINSTKLQYLENMVYHKRLYIAAFSWRLIYSGI